MEALDFTQTNKQINNIETKTTTTNEVAFFLSVLPHWLCARLLEFFPSAPFQNLAG